MIFMNVYIDMTFNNDFDNDLKSRSCKYCDVMNLMNVEHKFWLTKLEH
jgi:hypothetical protein